MDDPGDIRTSIDEHLEDERVQFSASHRSQRLFHGLAHEFMAIPRGRTVEFDEPALPAFVKGVGFELGKRLEQPPLGPTGHHRNELGNCPAGRGESCGSGTHGLAHVHRYVAVSVYGLSSFDEFRELPQARELASEIKDILRPWLEERESK